MTLNRVTRIDEAVPVRNVLVSVSDKTDLKFLVESLIEVNPHIQFFSTGGTFSQIETFLGKRASTNLRSVSDYTGQPEMQGGLVKTLDFKIYMGLLSETYNEDHRADLARTGSVEFDLVVVNLYPFSQTIANPGVILEDARSNIDIGGPCMLRASAKNFLRVASLCDPSDYAGFLEEVTSNKGRTSLKYRLQLAKKTFAHTADYDAAIARYLSSEQFSLSSIYQYQI